MPEAPATITLPEQESDLQGNPAHSIGHSEPASTYRKPTGELVRSVRPDTYRRVLDMLAEPRENVSYREIQRVCGIGGSTVKAIEAREQESVQERKAKLLSLSQRCAERAWHLVEDKLTDDVKLGQAVMVAGIATDKVALLTAEQTQPTATLNVQVNLPDLYSEFIKVSQAIKQAVASDVTPVTLQLQDGDNDHQAHQVG